MWITSSRLSLASRERLIVWVCIRRVCASVCTFTNGENNHDVKQTKVVVCRSQNSLSWNIIYSARPAAFLIGRRRLCAFVFCFSSSLIFFLYFAHTVIIIIITIHIYLNILGCNVYNIKGSLEIFLHYYRPTDGDGWPAGVFAALGRNGRDGIK